MSGFDDYESYDGLGLAELVRRGETTPDDLLDAAIERVEARNGRLNMVTVEMYDQARAAIADGLPDGPLSGVPFLLKDLGVLYEGAPTTNSCSLFTDFVADHDSEIVARYKRAGLVIFGRTNTPEVGFAPTTEPRLHGSTKNPWDTGRSSGGSSGGAAAAVAARVLPIAHATDGGGSIRIPAACCGVFGLKPTRGRNPVGPDLGEGMSGMSVGHAVSRTVRDSAALLDASSGPDVGDPYWAPPPARPFLDEVGADPGQLRIAVSSASPLGSPVHPDCVAAVEDAAQLCRNLGHEVEEAAPPIDTDSMLDAALVMWGANVDAMIRARYAILGQEPSASDLEVATWQLAEYGTARTATDYVRALQIMHWGGRQVARFFLDYDLLLTPTLATPPPELGVIDMSRDLQNYWRETMEFIPFTPLYNMTGQPAMSVPLGWNADGLPIGSHFVGRFGDEATLFRLAAQLEEARPWAKRAPPLS